MKEQFLCVDWCDDCEKNTQKVTRNKRVFCSACGTSQD